MDLKDFVKFAIVSVIEAVAEAQKEVASKGALINPADSSLLAGSKGRTVTVEANHQATALVEEVEFDVAVTTEGETGVEGGVGIKVWSIDFGVRSKGTTTDQQVSRIKFRVPVVYPPHIDAKVQHDRKRNFDRDTASLYSGFERDT